MAKEEKILTRHVLMENKYITDIHSAIDTGLKNLFWKEMKLKKLEIEKLFSSNSLEEINKKTCKPLKN